LRAGLPGFPGAGLLMPVCFQTNSAAVHRVGAVQPFNRALVFLGTRAKGSPGVRIILNGFPEDLEGRPISVQDILDRLQEDDPAVIVEVNGRFIHRRDFCAVRIEEGDGVEFIHPSFGG
jgi:thiamine biosynthesis protein ThiS